nr:FAD-binding oxidoreductase [Actinomycetota bacterium]
MDLNGVAPGQVVQAERVEDVVDTIRAANSAREAIVIRGGATRLDIGDPPERYDTCLDLRGLTGIVEFEPADLVATVRAGTTLSDLADALAEHGLRWPVEAGAHHRATVGGTIASAAGGPSRLRYFHPRDWTIGVQAVLGDGSLTRAGGRVVKNVTGYDLTK